MKELKKYFPLSFKYVKDGGNLAVGIIIYVVAAIVIPAVLTAISAVLGVILAFTIVLPFIIGGLIGIVNPLVGLYCLAGIVIQILVFTKTIKDPDVEA